MRISVTNARSPSLSFGDYARKKCSPCSHRTQRETARFGMRIPNANARSPSLSFGDYARNNLTTIARVYLLKTNLKHRRPVFAGNKKTFLFWMIGNAIQHFSFRSGSNIVFTHNARQIGTSYYLSGSGIYF